MVRNEFKDALRRGASIFKRSEGETSEQVRLKGLKEKKSQGEIESLRGKNEKIERHQGEI
jgi:hypothetical protein